MFVHFHWFDGNKHMYIQHTVAECAIVICTWDLPCTCGVQPDLWIAAAMCSADMLSVENVACILLHLGSCRAEAWLVQLETSNDLRVTMHSVDWKSS